VVVPAGSFNARGYATGDVADATPRRALAAGCVPNLLKPFSGRTLIDAVAIAVAE
jgi:hypothetical protein